MSPQTVQIITMSVMLGFFVLLGLSIPIILRIVVGNKWYLEIIDRDTTRFELCKPVGSEFKAKDGGTYTVPRRKRVDIGYPPAVPKFFQIPVPHEKYAAGNPTALELPELDEDGDLANTITSINDGTDVAVGRFTKGMEAVSRIPNQKLAIVTVLAVGIVGVIAIVAAVMGYQSMQGQDEITTQIRNIAQAIGTQ